MPDRTDTRLTLAAPVLGVGLRRAVRPPSAIGGPCGVTKRWMPSFASVEAMVEASRLELLTGR